MGGQVARERVSDPVAIRAHTFSRFSQRGIERSELISTGWKSTRAKLSEHQAKVEEQRDHEEHITQAQA